MFRKLVDRLFGAGAWEDVDHDEVEQQLEARRERLRVDFDRADKYPYSHYTAAIEDVKQLKRDRAHDDVEALLEWCLDFIEAEARHHDDLGEPVAIPPAYYRHLAIVYQKDDRYADEVSVLERYCEACEEVGQEPRDGLVERLAKARDRASG